MKRTAAAFGLALLALGLCRPVHGQDLVACDETVSLDADGSAQVRLALELPSGRGPAILIPAPCAAPRDIRVQGLAPSSVAVLEIDGDRFLSVDASAAGPAPLSLVINFRTEGCFAGGRARAFGNRPLSYKFLNVSFDRIGKFGATLILPPGFVFNDVTEFSPKSGEAGGAVPYAFSRADGRAAVRLSADDVKLGDAVSLACTFKSDRKPKVLLVVLTVLAAAYLVFFRGLIKSDGAGRGAKP